MASPPKRPTHLEFRESDIPQPPPLRIIKCSKTVTSRTGTREIERGGRGPSICSDESRGSPPMTANRPLTVHKRRGGRGSLMDGSFDEPPSSSSSGGSAISDLIKKHTDRAIEDPDLTPKAPKQVPRTVSAGEFLKRELQGGSGDSDDYIGLSRLNTQGEQLSPPKIPERRLSKSKTFFFNFKGKKDKDPKPPSRDPSVTSTNTLIRRFSRSSKRTSIADTAYTDRMTSADSSYSLDGIHGEDIADVVIDPRLPSYHRNYLHSRGSGFSNNRSNYEPQNTVLCPEVSITPEVVSLDGTSANLWVAIEVSSVLRPANASDQSSAMLTQGQRCVPSEDGTNPREFGCLHSMRIDLLTTRDSSVLEVIGNLNEPKTFHIGDAHLILAKLRISKVTRSSSHIRESSTSDEIMADLENHLGGAITSYLTVRLSYRHSGFLQFTPTSIDWEGGMSSHLTKLQTEASACIKRHDLHSAWSPRTSRETHGALETNPLIPLIEAHFDVDRARDAIRRLANDRVPIPFARHVLNGSDAAGGSSEDTIRAVSSASSISARVASAASTSLIPPVCNVESTLYSQRRSLAPPVSKIIKVKANSDVDPARQIWTEMRRNSRGYRHPRGSVSADHYISSDLDDCSPSRLSSTDPVDSERRKIKDVALRNKRSVGADTLKSFAPSSLGKGMGSTLGGLGLGVGRSWWQSNNWW